MCRTRKEAFTDYADAITAVNRQLDRNPHLRNVSAYLCPWCDHYHLTKQALPQIRPGNTTITRSRRTRGRGRQRR